MQTLLKRHSNALHTYHVEMWNWLTENPKDCKPNWPGWRCKKVQKLCRVFKRISKWGCFACAVRDVLDYGNMDRCGHLCPIKWHQDENEIITPCVDYGSPFRMWRDASNAEKKREAAIVIASLPWRMPI